MQLKACPFCDHPLAFSSAGLQHSFVQHTVCCLCSSKIDTTQPFLPGLARHTTPVLHPPVPVSPTVPRARGLSLKSEGPGHSLHCWESVPPPKPALQDPPARPACNVKLGNDAPVRMNAPGRRAPHEGGCQGIATKQATTSARREMHKMLLVAQGRFEQYSRHPKVALLQQLQISPLSPRCRLKCRPP